MSPLLEQVRGRLRGPRSLEVEAGGELGGPAAATLRRAFRETTARRGGEASAARRAAELATLYARLSPDGKRAFLSLLASEFGTPADAVTRAGALLAGEAATVDEVAQAAREALSPPWLVVLRQFNLLPDGTRFLVDLHADLLELARADSSLKPLARDLKALLAEWFDPGFLQLRRITWNSPAALLERLAASEAVHAVASYDDLKNRLDPADRRFYAFFHPRMPEEPLIFVQVALRRGLATEIASLLDPAGPHEDPSRADTAIFYSISSAQPGLAGISLGGFLIKRVVDEVAVEFPRVKRFATLSPVPGFRRWLRSRDVEASPSDLEALCAAYLLHARRDDGRALDPVANFHLSNGARVERVNAEADPSPRGLRQSYGVMANYLYELGEIETNHEAYAAELVVAASAAVSRLARTVHGRVPEVSSTRRDAV